MGKVEAGKIHVKNGACGLGFGMMVMPLKMRRRQGQARQTPRRGREVFAPAEGEEVGEEVAEATSKMPFPCH